MSEEFVWPFKMMAESLRSIFGDKNAEATLYYLYMMADGEVSNNEKKLFNKICKELDIDNDAKKIIIKECKKIDDKNSDMLSIIIEEEIDKKSAKAWDSLGHARIVWNLINLGYADTVYSEGERKIVKHLIDKWGVEKEIYQEFVDTADTILALTKMKEWVLSTITEESVRDKKIKEINKAMKRLLSDVNLTIEELTYVEED